jgi:hypothetical protein
MLCSIKSDDPWRVALSATDRHPLFSRGRFVQILSVEIPLQATWPSREELALRDSVTNALTAGGLGKCTGAGAGRGKMDFSYRVEDESMAREAVASAMQKHMPGVTYTVTSRPVPPSA